MENFKTANDRLNDLLNQMDGQVIIDGIINPDKYFKSKYRILWILKEPNDEDNDEKWTYQDFFSIAELSRKKDLSNDPFKSRIFQKIICNSFGILNNDVDFPEVINCIKEEKVFSVAERFAFINIKKTPGGGYSYPPTIKQHYKQNVKILLSQISLCNPNIIIFGGTKTFFKDSDLENIGIDFSGSDKYYSLNGTSRMAFYNLENGLLIIDADHPSYWKITNVDYYNEMIDGVKIWKSE